MKNRSSDPTTQLPYHIRTGGIPLTGTDHFLLALECETKTLHDASHLAQVVLRLGPGFDAESFCNTINTLFQKIPFFGASIRSKWGGLAGPPVYHKPSPPDSIPIHQHSVSPEGRRKQVRNFPALFQELLNLGPLDLVKDPLIRFDLVENEQTTDLAITWLQILFDGAGINRFLSLLSTSDTPDEFIHRVNWNEEIQSPIEFPSPTERLLTQKQWFSSMKQLSRPAPTSPGGPLKRTPKRIGYDVKRFSSDHTNQLDERARQEAGIISPMIFYLAISLRAHHQLFVHRNDVPDRYLVPVAVDLRTGCSIHPMFRNHVSFLWFHAVPSDLNSRTELIDQLLEQKRHQMKSDLPRKMAISLDNNRYLPNLINRRLIRYQTEGELCSFFFAYTGAIFDGVSQLFGGTFVDGFPAPGVPPSPGSSMIWSHVNDQLTLTHLFQRGSVTSTERQIMRQQIDRERTMTPQQDE